MSTQRLRRRPGHRDDRATTWDAPLPPGPAAVLALQRTAGNAATVRALARAPVDTTENLRSPVYAGQPVLEAAFDNAPPLAEGMTGSSVAAVQQGLVDAGHDLPVSMQGGRPDGIFGGETDTAVREFQGTNVLGVDGLVGRETMGRLDELAGGDVSGRPEIGHDEQALGEHVVAGMERLNQTGAQGPGKGVWYRDNYFRAHRSDPDHYPWDDDWWSGYASPEHFERTGELEWALKPGMRASDALRAWLHGTTLADCATAIVAVELDTLRAALGDAEFDRRYGADGQPLVIAQGMGGTPLEDAMVSVEVGGGIGNRDLVAGDWVSFYNHPRYLLKHPGGDWQGENAVYTGTDADGCQRFTGLGAAGKSEWDLLATMAAHYSAPRTADDYVMLLDLYVSDAPEREDPRYAARELEYVRGLYERYLGRIPWQYREGSGAFPDTCTDQDILDAPPYILDGALRVGGFTGQANRIDPARATP
jgi:peptidoglycan hydrolase-like protein with peptidoglycan-binding domain